MDDYPHVTVAAIAEKDGKFLFVREESDTGIVINQPAGHLESGESILDAVVRETLEETAWHVKPKAFLGVSQYRAPANGVTYIRNSFVVDALYQSENVNLDDGIIEALWLSPEEASKMDLRSPLVMRDIHLYLTGAHYSLNLFYDHAAHT